MNSSRFARLSATCLAGLLTLSTAYHASAAALNFSTPANWTADTDITASGGNQLFAWSWGGATIVNGVVFNAATVNNGAVGPYLTLSSFTGNNATAFTANAAPFNALSGSYSNLLRGSVFNGTVATVSTATLNNLIPGHTYFVEVWVGDPRSGATTNRVVDVSSSGPAVTLYFNSTHAAGGVGQYTYATFVADATTQDIVFDGSTAVSPLIGIPQLNAMQLRDVTGVWSGTTSGDWADTDSTSQNFSGSSYAAVKAVATDVYFGDKDAAGNAVATSAISVGAGGASGANANFNNNSLAYTFNSADASGITGASGVTLSGSGTVTFNGPNTYTGNTTINGGTLVLGNPGSIGGSPAVVLGGGTLDASALGSLTFASGQSLSGIGIVKGSVTAASGSSLVPGGVAASGTISITNNLTLNGQTITFDLGFGPGSGDKIFVGNVLTLNSTCTLSLNYLQGLLAGGTYTLMTFGSKTGAGTVVLDTTYPGVTLNVNPTSVTLTVGGGGGNSGVWTNLAGGAWGGATNWQGNAIATNVDAVADFSTLNITAARTVTINGVKTIGHLVFGDTVQDANWTLSTGTNVLAVSSGKPRIIINTGQNTTISAALQGTQGFNKMGGGTLTLSGANNMSGGILVSAGALTGSAAGSFGSVNTVATANPITLSNALLTISAALANNAWTNNIIFQGTSNNITAGAATPGFRGSSGSSVISGGGILSVNCGGNTPALAGHMDGFTGTMIINGTSAGGLLFAHNQDSGFYAGADGITGSPNAVFDFEGGGVNYMYNGAMPSTNYIGELRGNGTAVLWAKNGRSGDVTLEIGGLGTSSEFAGAFKDNRMGATPYTPINIRKVGTGTLTLSGTSINTGFTDVRGGTLLVSGTLGATPVTVQNGATFELDGSASSPAITVNAGGTFRVGASAGLGSAAISVNGLMDVTAAGGTFNLAAATLSGAGSVSGSLTLAGSSINSGPIGAAGTLTINSGDFTATGGTMNFDLSNDPIGGINDRLVVNGNLNLNTPGVVISINKLSGILGAGNYTLIQFSGAFSGDLNNVTVTGADPLDFLQISGNQLQLVVSPIVNVVWRGGQPGNLWDINTSANWLLGGVTTTFTNGESVTFDNTGATNPVVTIPATVNPAAVFVTGSSNYTFTGAGDISDGATLTKSGTGTLTILNSNSFVGSTFINGGTLKLGDGVANNGSLAGNIADSSALVVANPLDQSLPGVISGSGSLLKLGAGMLTLTADSALTGPATISSGMLTLGDGVATTGSLGSGRITNNSALGINRVSAVTLSNTILGLGGIANVGVGPVTLAGTIAGSCSLTNDTGTGILNLATSNSYSGGTFINSGEVMLQNFSGFGSGSVIISDSGNGELHLAPVLAATNILANNIRLPAGTQQQFMMDGTSLGVQTTVRLNGVLSGGVAGTPTIFVDSGIAGNTRGVVVLANPANTFTTIPEVFRGTLAILSDSALGDPANGLRINSRAQWVPPFDVNQQGLRFDAANITLNAGRSIELVSSENIDVQSFTSTLLGPITGVGLIKLGSGTLVLDGPGSLTQNTAVSAGTLLINNSWSGALFTVSSGATLGGNGAITAQVTVSSGGTLAPGTSIGTLAISNSLVLSAGSTTAIELNAGTLACDKVVGLNVVGFSGTLNVVNTGGTLAQGQSFQLFSAASYTGNFTTTNLPALPTGLQWNWNPANGTLAVAASVATNPTNITAVVSGGNLNLSWPADHTGWRLEAQTNSPSAGLSTNWSTVPGSTAVNSMSFPIVPSNGSVFFRLVYP
jgi:autotransporter-associated beta strand protein